MYEVKEYYDGDKLFYGVYIKTPYNSYSREPSEEDNIVVLCYFKDIAERIKELLEIDHEFEERVGRL